MSNDLTDVRHQRSQNEFPELQLEDGEYVELAYSRAPVCLFLIWLGAGFGIALILAIFLLILLKEPSLDSMGRNFMHIILMSVLASIIIFALVETIVFRSNKLYITNRRVIQYIMKSPVSTSENFIDLFSVEDVSFRQDSLLQKIFNFGAIRLATVGDETTYTFSQAPNPKDQILHITHLIREAKATRDSCLPERR